MLHLRQMSGYFVVACDFLMTAACLKTVVGVSMGMLPVRFFRSSKSSFCVCEILWRSQDCHMVEVNLVTVCFRDISVFETVLFVSLWKLMLLARLINRQDLVFDE